MFAVPVAVGDSLNLQSCIVSLKILAVAVWRLNIDNIDARSLLIRACDRRGAAKFPARRSALCTGLPLTAPFPLRRPPAPLT